MLSKKWMYALALFSFAKIAIAQVGVLIKWPIDVGGNGHYYIVTYAGISANSCWSNARDYAYSRYKGHLVCIETEAENNFICSITGLSSGVANCNWIGAQKIDNTWTWINGQPYAYSNWSTNDISENYGSFISSYVPDQPCSWRSFNRCPAPAALGSIIELSNDCNGDGVIDAYQISIGQYSDNNQNGLPDIGLQITQQPISVSVSLRQAATFNLAVYQGERCSVPLQYQWQRRNPSVVNANDPTAWLDLSDGSQFVGTQTASLTVIDTQPATATGYRCKITGGCPCETFMATAYSQTVNFNIACTSDFNADGSVDGDDIIAFFEAWDSGC